MSTGISDQVLSPVSERTINHGNKISVIGVGQVGMASAFSCLLQGVTDNIALVDTMENKLQGEMLDLQHGSSFMNDPRIAASKDYKITENSSICVVTAGVRQNEGESRLDLVQRNTEVMKSIIPQLIKYSPNTILLIATNPVDVLTYVAWKISGLPKNRVIGSGTSLDTSRFKFFLSQRLGINVKNCHGWIIGEHGDSSVPVWSGVNIAGVRLQDISKGSDSDKWTDIHQQVINSASDVIKLKGYTCWAIGLAISNMCKAILSNSSSIEAVSTLVKGLYGIEDEVFLSLPCVLGENGVTDIVKQILTDEEREKLCKSAKILHEVEMKIVL